jgi:hypothetical protein
VSGHNMEPCLLSGLHLWVNEGSMIKIKKLIEILFSQVVKPDNFWDQLTAAILIS